MESNDGTFKDYDSLIPAPLWGEWYDTDFPDFSHFSGEGHALLAKQVGEDIQGLLGDPTAPGSQETSNTCMNSS